MKIDLIKGEFRRDEANALIGEMIQAKIRFHENKISSSGTEEDIKFREQKIKSLQDSWHRIRTASQSDSGTVRVDAELVLTNF
jgi:hypothetical protein